MVRKNSSRIKNWTKSRKNILVGFLLLSSVSSVIYLNQRKNVSGNVLSSFTRKMIYPTQLSDKQITRNAIESNPKFNQIAFAETDKMLANAVSTLIKPGNSSEPTPLEMGTWLWTPVLNQDEAYRNKIISNAVKNGIRNIYVSIDSYLDIYIMPDGKEKDAKKARFDKNIEDFIRAANKQGISVDAEAGWRNWAEEGHVYKALATLSYANKFNKTHDAKFRGFQYDVEPYLLDSYQENKELVLKNFLKLIDNSVSFLNNSDLEISVAIPEFYDGTNNDTPSFYYKGRTGYTIDHLLYVLDRRPNSKVLVMSYRNFSKGLDGSIDISSNEIDSANKHNTKIIIAQETGNVQPPYITFYNTNKKRFNREKSEIEKTFSLDKSYGGIAIHYINAFMDLK